MISRVYFRPRAEEAEMLPSTLLYYEAKLGLIFFLASFGLQSQFI